MNQSSQRWYTICGKLNKQNASPKLKVKTHLNWPVHVRLLDTQDNLPGNSHSIEEVVDESHVVDEGVHVAGAQHEQCRKALRTKKVTQRQKLRKRERFEGGVVGLVVGTHSE